MIKLESTMQYSKFKHILGNRKVEKGHVESLITSIKKRDLTSKLPILVSDDMEIIDGQHRFEACKRLKLPITYLIIGKIVLSDIQVLNSYAKNWNYLDYLDSYCDLGYEDYIKLRDFIEKYKCSVQAGIIALSGYRGNSLSFKRGDWVIRDYDFGVKFMDHIMEFGPLYKGSKYRTFLCAMRNVYVVKGYDPKQMISQLAINPRALVDCTNSITYLRILEEIYNYHKTNKLRFF